MENEKWYECKVCFSYLATDPLDAAKQFLDNIATNPNWYVEVKEVFGEKHFTVDTETDEIEEHKIE
jgi:hypothetical protein